MKTTVTCARTIQLKQSVFKLFSKLLLLVLLLLFSSSGYSGSFQYSCLSYANARAHTYISRPIKAMATAEMKKDKEQQQQRLGRRGERRLSEPEMCNDETRKEAKTKSWNSRVLPFCTFQGTRHYEWDSTVQLSRSRMCFIQRINEWFRMDFSLDVNTNGRAQEWERVREREW